MSFETTATTTTLMMLLLGAASGVGCKSSGGAPPASSAPAAAPKGDMTKEPTLIGRVERLDPALDAIVDPQQRVEQLAQGFRWSEGPLWVPDGGGRLLFSDVPNNVVLGWTAATGITEFLKPSGYTGTVPRGGEPGANGLALDSQGRLLLCQHGDRRVARLEQGGGFATVADRYDGKRLNSPNDLVVRSNGDVYFTDPPYGLVKHNEDPSKEIPFSGVYRVSAADGKVTLLTKELTYPNGIAFSPDERTLYVANSDPNRAIWMAYPVLADGGIGPGRVFFDATPMVKAGGKPGLPDGLKLDEKGNLFASGPGGILVFTPDGKHLGTIVTGEPTANCAWGDDGSTLYMTANDKLCRIRVLTSGMRR